MVEQPPTQLIAMLERLGVANPAQVAAVSRRVGRLARDLPRFESVWVDALSQARILTPYQAAEINAGRGDSLRIGPYLLHERLSYPCYVESYRAKHVESGAWTRVAIVANPGPRNKEIVHQLELLAGQAESRNNRAASAGLPSSRITQTGIEAGRVFAAAPWVEGRTAAEWMVHQGRFPPEVVLEIARAMLSELVDWQGIALCHGDVSTSSLLLNDRGGVALLFPGLRAILRPEEGYAYTDLLPEGYDSLAPERVSEGTPPNTLSDVYACGCVWWHLLCGRPPLPGGNSLAKLRAAQTAEIHDLRRYAPDVPAPLAAAISACLQRDPHRRPDGPARLAATLGPSTRAGRDALADCLAQTGCPTVRWSTTARSMRRSNRAPVRIAGIVCCVATAVALIWPAWQRSSRPAASQKASSPTASVIDARLQTPAVLPASWPNENATIHEDNVVPVVYQKAEPKPADLVLADDAAWTAEALTFHAGQCVRAPAGKRATVDVSAGAVIVDKEDVCFENIDFIGRPAAVADRGARRDRAAVQLSAGRAEFRGCSFQSLLPADKPHDALTAIRWTHPTQSDMSAISLPNGRVCLEDCLFDRVAAGLDCHTLGALVMELKNVLHVESGPLVRLDHCPQSDEPLSLALGQVTLRGGGPLLECLAPRAGKQAGEVTIFATACALAPEAGVPLVRIVGREMPAWFSTVLRWSGQGSLVSPPTPMIAWLNPDGEEQPLDESSLSIAGLVRSEVVFVGDASPNPAANRLIRWQAPLQSANPPGIDAECLPQRTASP